MERKLEAVIPPEADGILLGTALQRLLRLSRHRVRSLKFCGGLLVNGSAARTDTVLRTGDRICAVLRDQGPAVQPAAIPLTVLYRDTDLLVLSKPAPMAVAGNPSKDPDTLENAVFDLLGCPDGFVFRPVSRLDKGTSGLTAIALNAHVHYLMQKLLHTSHYERTYLAVTDGHPAPAEGVIRLPIRKTEGVRRVVDPQGKPCVTHYRTLERAPGGRSLIRLRLESGRTHQIRVHLQALGCPVTGDYLYGREHPLLPGRFALHSAALSFVHPITGQALRFEAPPPEVFSALLEEKLSAACNQTAVSFV